MICRYHSHDSRVLIGSCSVSTTCTIGRSLLRFSHDQWASAKYGLPPWVADSMWPKRAKVVTTLEPCPSLSSLVLKVSGLQRCHSNTDPKTLQTRREKVRFTSGCERCVGYWKCGTAEQAGRRSAVRARKNFGFVLVCVRHRNLTATVSRLVQPTSIVVPLGRWSSHRLSPHD